ncbi:N-acetyl-gamma-glutamyl-phosphate reductase [Paraburkholderia sp. MM5482-R1]|uniref:N-acetyl-gamma-glutamyl-phosphate reductase n=1 Tax=unclassified Paraburkholderia TaxID=2615204 RepID=UPI003D229A6E
MNKRHIFIDGASGTTGLQIRDRLTRHPGVKPIDIDHASRREVEARYRMMRAADVTILCLPDDAARDAVALAADAGCRLLDASSAHRIADGWTFGLPELHPGQRAQIRDAARVSNPGCYATGAILLLRPLVDAALLQADREYAVTAVSGYTGGGNRLIERYEAAGAHAPAFAAYGLDFGHKHVPEIAKWSGLGRVPCFLPAVGNFRQGMLVCVQLDDLPGVRANDLHHGLSTFYANERCVRVRPYGETDPETAPFLTPHEMEGSNHVDLYVFGPRDGCRALLVAKLDNLGKGASGAAVQNLNIMLGLDEHTATVLER